MSITKQVVSIADGVTESGQVNVKTITRVMENGSIISESVHRKVLNPGDPLDGESAQVVAVANAVWTPEVVAAWQEGNPSPVQDWRPQAIADLNVMRAKIMAVLTSMQTDYIANGQTDNAAACLGAKEQLRAIETAPAVATAYTTIPGSRADFDAAVKARWLEIVAPAPAQVKSDFNKYGGNTV